MAMALACYDYYKSVAGDEVSVKWPNDIYWRDRKAGGILVENLIQSGMWTWSIVGIGLNINQTRFDPSISRKPVSLKQITGRDIDLMEALNALAVQLRYRWDELRRSHLGILEAYEAVLYKKGEKVKFKKDNRVFEAIVQGVDAYGRLRVESNIEELFAHGEIEWL
jgi:BirA family biotin operon repressor/biotin-[acetyl-CoA-carboxylase] ligase